VWANVGTVVADGRRHMRHVHPFAFGSILLLAVACSSAPGLGTNSANDTNSASVTPDEPANFFLVSPGIYRGGHPDAGGLEYLKNLGVTTIIDLEIGDFIEATPAEIDSEIAGATALGINDIREPMSAFELALSSRFDSEINQILAILANPAQKPVYVHCRHGQDRTGLVIGLERVFNEGWTPSAAWNEMLAHGFHVGFLGLSDYFFRKTGWNPTDGSGSSADSGTGGPGASDGGPGTADGGVGEDGFEPEGGAASEDSSSGFGDDAGD
jgi:tyrosine-protein phosphatase SIW14